MGGQLHHPSHRHYGYLLRRTYLPSHPARLHTKTYGAGCQWNILGCQHALMGMGRLRRLLRPVGQFLLRILRAPPNLDALCMARGCEDYSLSSQLTFALACTCL